VDLVGREELFAGQWPPPLGSLYLFSESCVSDQELAYCPALIQAGDEDIDDESSLGSSRAYRMLKESIDPAFGWHPSLAATGGSDGQFPALLPTFERQARDYVADQLASG
jgi:hypothetical protein